MYLRIMHGNTVVNATVMRRCYGPLQVVRYRTTWCTTATSSDFNSPPADQRGCGIKEQRPAVAATWWSPSSTSGRSGVQCRFGRFGEHVVETCATERRTFHVAVSADPLRCLRSELSLDRRPRVGGGSRTPPPPWVVAGGGCSGGRTEVRLRADEDDGDRGRAEGVQLGKPAADDTGQWRSAYHREADDHDVGARVRDESHPIELRLRSNHRNQTVQ